MYTLATATTIPNLAFEFEEIAQTISTVYSANLALARIKSAAIVGVGVAVPLIFASTSDYMNREYFNKIVKNYSNPDLEITEEDRRMLYSCNDEGYFATASNYNYYTTNLTIEQGFINCNIITTQQIPEIFTNKIGIGLAPTNFPLDVVGNINADYYYRSGVKQFVGTSNQHSNLNISQGFINSNVLTTQTIPSISTNDIGFGNSSRIGIYSDRIENLVYSIQTNGMFIKDILTYTPYLGFITAGTYGTGIYNDYIIQKNQNRLTFSTKKNTALNKDKTYKVSDIRGSYLILDGVGHNCTTTVTTTLPTFLKNYFVEDIKMLRKEKLDKIDNI
jgi:hypothetical protein